MIPTPSLSTIIDDAGAPPLIDSHPPPRYIFLLWQRFVESVDPVAKIVHIPTLQKRILEASWNPSTASKPLTAIMFAVYTLAVTSMSETDCQNTFAENRAKLVLRYRTAALRALVAADFLTTLKHL